VLSTEPLVEAIEYLSVGCPVTMSELEEVGHAGAIVSLAIRMGAVVRLIDNIVLPPVLIQNSDADLPPQQQQQQRQAMPVAARSDARENRQQ